MNPLLLELALPLIGSVLTAFVGIGAAFVKKRFDITLEATDRDALHSALQTGVNSLVAKLSQDKVHQIIIGPIEDASVKGVRQTIINGAIEYAKTSVPEALKRLDPSIAILSTIAMSKLEGLVRGQLGKPTIP